MRFGPVLPRQASTTALKLFSIVVLAVTSMTGSASAAVVPFTETFNADASAWLTGASTAPTYNTSGGIDGSGYISYTSTFTSGATGMGGTPPQAILFRGNNAANASGDAFVGNWFTAGVDTFSVAVRHNYTSTLSLYARLDAGAGAAASLAPNVYSITPDTWTTITFPITNSNPPFVSFGGGNFNSVFSNIQNVQLGLYLPASTTFTDLRFDIDNVSLSAVPEPGSLTLISLAMGALVVYCWRRKPLGKLSNQLGG